MTTTTLALFDLTDLNPDKPRICGWCGDKPATTRVHATQNLLGVHAVWLGPTWYRNATHRARSGPCCNACAWYVASAWWNPTYACPQRGTCHLWAHTLTDPQPGRNCQRCHREHTVVWRTTLERAS